ncbi:RNA-splicing ligase RtcB [Deinococcus maricopensis]|uniref:RNA-splicing ligase RtcB n=1 Tax=Deinococcus maricopensis TaxID=309887 RepID=UPI0002FFD3EF|nr:RNA-splicing ligase RtcB [Deinococcus maricopensis]
MFAEGHGSRPAPLHAVFDDWVRGGLKRDAHLGSIGGGNHFVEVQVVERVLDARTAYAWGVRPGAVCVMVHSGSLGFGHAAAHVLRALAGPAGGHVGMAVPLADAALAHEARTVIANAANFAFVNRALLTLQALDALRRVTGDFSARAVYDAPHNLTWGALHRKGATPARGPGDAALLGTPFEHVGEPVLVPGSMGDRSFLLVGRGCGSSLHSAAHGAGRALARGRAMRDAGVAASLEGVRVVTPVNPRTTRADVWARKRQELAQEAPAAYKAIAATVDTLERAGMALPVAALRPLLTVKG